MLEIIEFDGEKKVVIDSKIIMTKEKVEAHIAQLAKRLEQIEINKVAFTDKLAEFEAALLEL